MNMNVCTHTALIEAYMGTQVQRLDLLRKWAHTRFDVVDCTVSLIVTEMRRRSCKTKSAWLNEPAIVAHYFGDVEKAKQALF